MSRVVTPLRNPGRTRADHSSARCRSTVTFDGGSGSGAAGTVLVFTVTGAVWIKHLAAYCSVNLAESGATATIQFGTATTTNFLITVINAVDIDAGDLWIGGTATASSQEAAGTIDAFIAENAILTIAVADVTAGVIAFNAWYEPITDDGLLS